MIAVWLSIIVLLGVLVLLMPRAESGESTLALRRFLAGSGLDVSEGGPPPSPDGTYVLLHDLRTPDEARSLLDWVEGGGRLVVADPASEVVGLAGAEAGEPLGLVGAQTLEPACVAEEVVGVRRVVARASERMLRGDPFASCFGGLVLVRAHGSGSVVLLGGFTAFTNEYLRSADNALFALRTLGRGSARVVRHADRSPRRRGADERVGRPAGSSESDDRRDRGWRRWRSRRCEVGGWASR